MPRDVKIMTGDNRAPRAVSTQWIWFCSHGDQSQRSCNDSIPLALKQAGRKQRKTYPKEFARRGRDILKGDDKGIGVFLVAGQARAVDTVVFDVGQRIGPVVVATSNKREEIEQ